MALVLGENEMIYTLWISDSAQSTVGVCPDVIVTVQLQSEVHKAMKVIKVCHSLTIVTKNKKKKIILQEGQKTFTQDNLCCSFTEAPSKRNNPPRDWSSLYTHPWPGMPMPIQSKMDWIDLCS